MAVSPAGLVELDKDSAAGREVFGADNKGGEVVIRPDLEKLDLSVRELHRPG